MSTPEPPNFRALLGSYFDVVATAFEGVQVANTKVLEALEAGDSALARELSGVVDDNVASWRKAFNFMRELP